MRVAAVLFVLIVAAGRAAADEVVVEPEDTGAPLRNPGMGWVFHHYDNALSKYGAPLGPRYDGREFPGMTTIYFRLAWAHLEPREGEFRWDLIDTPAQRYLAAGMKIAFRFTCSETSLRYATPEWVAAAGAKGTFYDRDDRTTVVNPEGKLWEPDFDDPVFLAKLSNFLAAAAARYDGDPRVAFIDVGSFGVWGEGHTNVRRYDPEVVKQHIDLHRQHFRRTLLAGQDDWPQRSRLSQLAAGGELAIPIRVAPATEAAGRQFAVKLGIWLPRDTSRPDGRFLPAAGDATRRVTVGTLTVEADGTPHFSPAPATTAESAAGADYSVKVGDSLVRRGQHWLLPVDWSVLTPLPPGATPFCHFEAAEQIVFSGWPIAGEPVAQDYAKSLGFTLRDDSILVRGGADAFFNDWMVTDIWPDRPVILEMGHYQQCLDEGTWQGGERYLDAVEAYHASYASVHGDPVVFLADNADLVRRMNLRLGYRPQLVEARWPREAGIGQTVTLSTTWRNGGVAPCQRGTHPIIWLADESGALQAVLGDAGFDLADLTVAPAGQPAPAAESRMVATIPDTVQPGRLHVLVAAGEAWGTPRLELPLADSAGDRIYRLGSITVRGEYAVTGGEPAVEGGVVTLPLRWQVRQAVPEATPFCHLVDTAGTLLGQPAVTVTSGQVSEVGEATGEIRLQLPTTTEPVLAQVLTGLWRSGDQTRPWGRLQPDQADAQRRCPLAVVLLRPETPPLVGQRAGDGWYIAEAQRGEGEPTSRGQTIAVHYRLSLPDGTPVDSSHERGQPFTFRLGAGQVIPGWDGALVGWPAGSRFTLILPPHLAYGDRGGGPIPPSSWLVFEVEVIAAQ